MLELPEVITLSGQLNQAISGKTIALAGRGNSPHRFAFIKPSEEEFSELLARRKVKSVTGDGKCISFELRPRGFLCIAEMDGRILFHERGAALPPKHHVQISFTDGTSVTATVGLWGFFGAGSPEPPVLVDQAGTIDPLGREFTVARLRLLFAEYPKPNHPIKAFLINRPRLRGFGNGYMQEILFRAGILPTRPVGTIDDDEKRLLHRAIRQVLSTAAKQGGSSDACDIYGRPGKYEKVLGARVKACTVCGTAIQKKTFLGGATYFCTHCQK